MFDLTRRDLLRSMAAAGLGSSVLRAAPPAFKVGVTDWNLRLGAKTEAVALAKQLGFDGVQLSFGRRLVEDKLPVDNPEILAQYKKLSAEHKIPLDGTCVD